MNRSKGTILIVEDQQKAREFLGEILEEEGYAVLFARDGYEALERIKENNINLVLLDLDLPGIHGMEVLKEALRLKPQQQVVIVSGTGNISMAVEATKTGAYDYIEKPFDPKKMLVVVKRAVEKDMIIADLEAYRKEAVEKYKMIGVTPAIQKVYRLIEKAAPSKAKVLITGESGVGKELVARAIHQLSPRATKPFQKVNCAAIPSELIEAELFGHEKGAFTDARERRIGRFEMAHTGTIFLDEIGDMSLMTQAKVLRVLEGEEVQRVGGSEELRVDVRGIAATRKDLMEEIHEGNFREDLFYRLNVITIWVPPLRERKDDIPILLRFYLEAFCDENNVPLKKLTPDALVCLTNREWKGNIRELKNLVEKLVVLTDSEYIDRQHVLAAIGANHIDIGTQHAATLADARREFEREYILRTLTSHEGNVSKTAETLGIDRANLYRKMKRLGIPSRESPTV